MYKCNNCHKRKPIVFRKEYRTLNKLLYEIRICKDCCFILINQLFDYTIGCEYDHLVTRYGKQKKDKYAKRIQKDGRSYEKSLRRKKRGRNSKQNMEQTTQRNRKNSRKRKKVKI